MPDAADADHGCGAPGLEARDELLHRVVGRDARVGVRRDRRRLDAVRQPDDRPLVDEDVLREAAVSREPRELVSHAEHVLAAAAGDAEPAAPRGMEEDRVAHGGCRDVVADRVHPARVLVPEDDGDGEPAGSISPSIACRSVAQTPAPPTRTTTLRGPLGSGSGRSTSSSGRWYSARSAALMRRPVAFAPR